MLWMSQNASFTETDLELNPDQIQVKFNEFRVQQPFQM